MSNASESFRSAHVHNLTQAVDALRQELVGISLDIHAHPELNYQEYHAAQVLTDALERHGFQVERGVGGVETAFRAILSGSNPNGPTVALLAEYDALPGIGPSVLLRVGFGRGSSRRGSSINLDTI